MSAKVESVNVGGVREVEWHGRLWRTGIYKTPASGRLRVEGVNIEGDRQANLSVHGGPTKSVYLYPGEHYDAWREELTGTQREILATPGAFGENLTTRGLLESDIGIGDRVRIGTAVLRVTEPRMPCAKLGLRFDDPGMTKRFYAAGRNGIYFGIDAPGEIGAGDELEVVERHPVRLTVAEVVELHTGRLDDSGLRKVAATHPALSPDWRESFAD